MSRPVRIPSYRLHKPSGQAIVTIRGRMFYLGRFGSVESCSEYGRIIAEWQAGSPETPPASPTMPSLPADLTVAELFLLPPLSTILRQERRGDQSGYHIR